MAAGGNLFFIFNSKSRSILARIICLLMLLATVPAQAAAGAKSAPAVSPAISREFKNNILAQTTASGLAYYQFCDKQQIPALTRQDMGKTIIVLARVYGISSVQSAALTQNMVDELHKAWAEDKGQNGKKAACRNLRKMTQSLLADIDKMEQKGGRPKK